MNNGVANPSAVLFPKVVTQKHKQTMNLILDVNQNSNMNYELD